jgi:hypothetical protein
VKFQPRRLSIDAAQYTSASAIRDFILQHASHIFKATFESFANYGVASTGRLIVQTSAGNFEMSLGDWFVFDDTGRPGVMSNAEFSRRYEQAAPSAAVGNLSAITINAGSIKTNGFHIETDKTALILAELKQLRADMAAQRKALVASMV